MSTELLIKIFEKANDKFIKNDMSLMELDVSERSWYSRFSIYLEETLKENNIIGYFVDTEYNRNGNRLKTIFDEDNLEIINITCDVIVHSRGENIKQDNLICIEMKKEEAPKQEKENDKKRLKILTKSSYDFIWSVDGKCLPEHVCNYLLGVYYEFDKRNNILKIEYYKEGKQFLKKKIVL